MKIKIKLTLAAVFIFITNTFIANINNINNTNNIKYFHADIIINTNPSDAEIYIDDGYKGKGTVITSITVATIIKITVKKDGYKTKTVKLKYKAPKGSEFLDLDRGKNQYLITLDLDENYKQSQNTNIYNINSSNYDLIQKTNGTEIQAKILEVSSSEIKYKNFDYLDGPTIVLPISEISSIKYPNGKTETFSKSASSNQYAAINEITTTVNETNPCKWCTTSNTCVEVKTWYGTVEGSCENYSKVINKTNKTLTYKLCIQRADGTWDCTTEELKPNAEGPTNYHCNISSGFKNKIWVAYGEFMNQSCKFPAP